MTMNQYIPANLIETKSLRDPNRRVVLITGSHKWTDEGAVTRVLLMKKPTLVVHGACPTGADALTDKACKILGIPVKRYPADWKKHGKAAGPIRNTQMLKDEKPDYVVAFWDGESRGTKHCIDVARRMGYTVEVWQPSQANPVSKNS